MGCAWGEDDINLERNQFSRESGEPLRLPLGIAVFNHEVAALDVTEVTQSLEEGLNHVGGSGHVEGQEAYSSDLGRLLGLGSERAEGAEEGAPVHHRCPSLSFRTSTAPTSHSITWSARCSSDGGIFRPSALAVLRLMTSSNLVGCSTGRSLGLAPLSILST